MAEENYIMKVKEFIKQLELCDPEADFVIKNSQYADSYNSPTLTEDEYYEAADNSVYFLSESSLEELEQKYQADVLDFVSLVIAQ